MELVLRAYDHEQVRRAEATPIDRLWMLLESGGLRDRAKRRVGLDAEPDEWARETVASRLESLIQEGYGTETLARLREPTPLEPAPRRRQTWPPIEAEEAVALREDMVRYLTYGLWKAPEETVAHALAMLTQQSDATFLLSDPQAVSSLQMVLDTIDDDQRFAEHFGPAVGATLAAGGKRRDEAVREELRRLQQLLGPAARLLRGAREVGLRVIAYQDTPGGDGLTRFLAADLNREERNAQPLGKQSSNGRAPELPHIEEA